MATILKLTNVKKDLPIRINFDLVTHYYEKDGGTEIMFLGERFNQARITVKETPQQIDGFLGKA